MQGVSIIGRSNQIEDEKSASEIDHGITTSNDDRRVQIEDPTLLYIKRVENDRWKEQGPQDACSCARDLDSIAVHHALDREREWTCCGPII
ncbi:hypothetical protein Ancab_010963 [Ancistrocladus abbreviatus]